MLENPVSGHRAQDASNHVRSRAQSDPPGRSLHRTFVANPVSSTVKEKRRRRMVKVKRRRNTHDSKDPALLFCCLTDAFAKLVGETTEAVTRLLAIDLG